MTVHVIDDDQAMRESLDFLLGVQGFSVALYSSAAEFLAALPGLPAGDCILSDISMPGMDEDRLFEFLGRVLGKALAEGVVVQPQFARFFLAKLLHKPTHMHDHLPYLDMVRAHDRRCHCHCHLHADVAAVCPPSPRNCTRT